MNEYAALIFCFFYIKIKKHKKILKAQTKIKSSSPKKTTYNQNPKAKKEIPARSGKQTHAESEIKVCRLRGVGLARQGKAFIWSAWCPFL